ncbi:hypothetical protein OIU77_009353 [Salix suchowensis]|uniref:Uncharacterized protein n=1 Tax=Salix suchowensis TaxID=1278906 RepID=A0ABQ9AEA1_9ROSI|nr:hypothetical protein OIU77_009353 [Salix suchowensis]
MVLPLLKLGTLALKTLSKPLASKLKQQAALHPKFRQFIINIAQTNHRITTRTQRRIYGHATDVEIRPLNEEKAVQAAVDLIGEVFVFTVFTPSARLNRWESGDIYICTQYSMQSGPFRSSVVEETLGLDLSSTG